MDIPLINCHIAKLESTCNSKKFQQVRIIQDGSQLLLLSLCLLVLYHDLEAPLIFVTFPFWIINALEIRSDTECNKSSFTLLCRTSEEKFRLEARDPGNNPQKILPKSPKIIPKFFPSGTKMPALGSVGGVRNRKMWSVFCRTNFIFCRKNSSIL